METSNLDREIDFSDVKQLRVKHHKAFHPWAAVIPSEDGSILEIELKPKTFKEYFQPQFDLILDILKF